MTELTIIYAFLFVPLVMLLVFYNGIRVYFAIAPSIATYFLSDKWFYVKGYDKLKLRKLILAFSFSLILLCPLKNVLPQWKGNIDLDFIFNVTWSAALVFFIYILHKIASKYHSESLVFFLRYYFQKEVTTDMILNVTNDITPIGKANLPTKGFHLIRANVKNDSFDLNVCLEKYGFQINTDSILELKYLIIYGEIANKKIKIETNTYKDGQVSKGEIFQFLLDIFILEHFNAVFDNKIDEGISKNKFVKYLNKNFEIITKEGSIREIHFNDLNRFLDKNFTKGV